MRTAIDIIMMVHCRSLKIHPSQSIFERYEATFAIVATVMQPAYRQMGHQVKAMLLKGESHSSILVWRITIIREIWIMNITITESPMYSYSHTMTPPALAKFAMANQGPVLVINSSSLSLKQAT